MAEKVGMALDKWVKEGGYRDSSTNISKVSREVYLSRRELSEYFDLHLHSTFRIWLSDIRLAEAQKMITAQTKGIFHSSSYEFCPFCSSIPNFSLHCFGDIPSLSLKIL